MFANPVSAAPFGTINMTPRNGWLHRWAQEVEEIAGPLNGGTIWRVNSAVSASGAGKTWATAFKTIAEAVAAASAGDTILIKGTAFSEAVTLTSKNGLRIIGVGTGPNQATWTGAADAVCLTINSTDVLVENIKFRPPAYSAGTPAAIQLGTGASYTTIRGCRFQGKAGSWYAIYSPACGADNVTIEDNEFIYLNTATYGAGILGVEAGGLSYSGWKIRRNSFNSCVTNVNINGRVCEVTDNVFGVNGINAAGAGAAVCTLSLDLSGTSSYGNTVGRNTFGGAYTTRL